MRLKSLIIALTLALLAWQQGSAQATVHNISTGQELATALFSSQSNGADDTINLAAGAYLGNFTFTSAEAFAITIKAEDGLNPGQVILDGNTAGRVLSMFGGDFNVNVLIENITIQNGSLTETVTNLAEGAGLYISSTTGTIEISRSIVKNCYAEENNANGGGMYLSTTNEITLSENNVTENEIKRRQAGQTPAGAGLYINDSFSVTMSKNIFTNNFSYYTGGATYNSYAGGVYIKNPPNLVSIKNNTFVANDSKYYGALFVKADSETTFFEISNNTFSQHNGGAVYVQANTSTATLNISENVFSNNIGKGAVMLHYGNMKIENNIFIGNESNISSSPGAGYISGFDTLFFSNNTILNNKANSGDYGAFRIATNTTTSVFLSNNVISGNSAAASYGGLYIEAGVSTDFINNTITGNSATNDVGGVYIDVGLGETLTFQNNIVWGNTATSNPAGQDIHLIGDGTRYSLNNNYDSLFGFWSTSTNDINVAPLFVDEANNDYHLTGASPCLETGDNSHPLMPATDLEGNTRITGIIDLGAYEHSNSEYHPADTNQDWFISVAEATTYGDNWRTAAASHPIDYVTRAGYISAQNSGHYENKGGGRPLCWETLP